MRNKKDQKSAALLRHEDSRDLQVARKPHPPDRKHFLQSLIEVQSMNRSDREANQALKPQNRRKARKLRLPRVADALTWGDLTTAESDDLPIGCTVYPRTAWNSDLRELEASLNDIDRMSISCIHTQAEHP